MKKIPKKCKVNSWRVKLAKSHNHKLYDLSEVVKMELLHLFYKSIKQIKLNLAYA